MLASILNVSKMAAAAREDDCAFNHVAIVLANKSIVSIGTNSKSHPLAINYRKQVLHAEIDALTKVDASIFYNGTKVKLYSLRFNAELNLTMAKPCKICQRILAANYPTVEEVYYSTYDGEIVKL